jgi:uncharacterized protein (TIRG00374 family)
MGENPLLQSEAAEVSTTRGRFKFLGFVLKALVSVGLIAVIFWKLNLATVWEKSRQLSAAVIFLVILMFVVQTFIAASRWWVILRHHQADIRLPTAVRFSFIGAFFNQLLPSSIGGDVARAWYAYSSGCSKKISVISVLSDRIYGMVMLAGLALAFFPVLVFYSVSSDALIVVGIVIIAASSALIAAFWLDHLPAWTQRWAFMRHLGALSQATRAVSADGRAAAPLLGLSFLIHGITVLGIVVLLEAVAPQLNLLLCAALVPVIMLMATVPVSIAGWGVRESVMIYGLGLAKAPPEAALIASILVGLSLAAVGLLGGVTWLIRPNRPDAV